MREGWRFLNPIVQNLQVHDEACRVMDKQNFYTRVENWPSLGRYSIVSAVEIVVSNTLVMDNDSTTISRVKATVDPDITKRVTAITQQKELRGA
ncbi:hypothetical protein FSP39_025067 [Pinctada imbricata]|uniref:Uncharacterized protein n=1 Tax=Pinctada imbricata TaxID=66713 RepID=A0AA89BN48_PINIB|nr:hypothetical protein FSP39_025067 [Pinctada imbricata]